MLVISCIKLSKFVGGLCAREVFVILRLRLALQRVSKSEFDM